MYSRACACRLGSFNRTDHHYSLQLRLLDAADSLLLCLILLCECPRCRRRLALTSGSRRFQRPVNECIRDHGTSKHSQGEFETRCKCTVKKQRALPKIHGGGAGRFALDVCRRRRFRSLPATWSMPGTGPGRTRWRRVRSWCNGASSWRKGERGGCSRSSGRRIQSWRDCRSG